MTTTETPAVLAGTCPAVVEKLWPPAPQSVGRARQFLVRQLETWGLAPLAESAELVLSELATNAVRHAYPPYGRLFATRVERLESGGVRIEVHDASDVKPEPRDASTFAESGRGLALVDALTGGRWGVSDRNGPGKCVWAVCAEDGAGAAG